MKRILLILIFMALYASLGAEEKQLDSDTIEYDTVVTESRFSYAFGVRYIFANQDLNVEWRHSSNFTPPPITMKEEATISGFNISFQAEWKYLLLDIAPGFYITGVKGMGSESNAAGISVNPLGKIPVSDWLAGWMKPRYADWPTDLHFSVLAGPELLVVKDNISMFMNMGVDFGIETSKRNILFFQFVFGFAVDDKEFVSDSFFLDSPSPAPSYSPVRSDGRDAIKFQFTVGLKTMQLDDVFYLKGKEVGRRRR